MRLLILLGTKKGAFLLQSDRHRRAWSLRGPFCNAWPINHVKADEITGTIYAAGGNEWFGPAVWKDRPGRDLDAFQRRAGATPKARNPVRPDGALRRRMAGLYAGVQPAGPVLSAKMMVDLDAWHGLRDHPSCPQWQPGAGGLILHSHRARSGRRTTQMWVAISAAGVFHTAGRRRDLGSRATSGTRCDFLPEEQRYPEFGQCVHCLVMAPGPLGSSVPAEPLRHVSQCRWWRNVAEHRERPSLHVRLPRRGASARSFNAVPISVERRRAGRYVPDAQCRGLAHARWAKRGRRCATAYRRSMRSSGYCDRR